MVKNSNKSKKRKDEEMGRRREEESKKGKEEMEAEEKECEGRSEEKKKLWSSTLQFFGIATCEFVLRVCSSAEQNVKGRLSA